MSQLQKQIRSSVKSGSSVPAIVVDVFYSKATIQLSGNGAIMRNLSVIGGPVSVGQIVEVDFTTPVPTVVAKGGEWASIDDLSKAIAGLGELSMSGAFTWQILTFSQGVIENSYGPDSDGLQSALNDLEDGVIYIPAVTITGDFSTYNNINLVGMHRDKTIIQGTLELPGGLTNLSIQNMVNSSDDVYALKCVAKTANANIDNCYIYCSNDGVGNAYGVWLEGSKHIRFSGCHLEGAAAAGGYGIYISDECFADTYMNGGYLGGTTHPYLSE